MPDSVRIIFLKFEHDSKYTIVVLSIHTCISCTKITSCVICLYQDAGVQGHSRQHRHRCLEASANKATTPYSISMSQRMNCQMNGGLSASAKSSLSILGKFQFQEVLNRAWAQHEFGMDAEAWEARACCKFCLKNTLAFHPLPFISLVFR